MQSHNYRIQDCIGIHPLFTGKGDNWTFSESRGGHNQKIPILNKFFQDLRKSFHDILCSTIIIFDFSSIREGNNKLALYPCKCSAPPSPYLQEKNQMDKKFGKCLELKKNSDLKNIIIYITKKSYGLRKLNVFDRWQYCNPFTNSKVRLLPLDEEVDIYSDLISRS